MQKQTRHEEMNATFAQKQRLATGTSSLKIVKAPKSCLAHVRHLNFSLSGSPEKGCLPDLK